MRLEQWDPSLIDNPALQHHYCVLQALALHETEPEAVEDLLRPEPTSDILRERVQRWKDALWHGGEGCSTSHATSAARRPASQLAPSQARSRPRKVDDYSTWTVAQLKELLLSRGQSVAGKKADLVERCERPQ